MEDEIKSLSQEIERLNKLVQKKAFYTDLIKENNGDLVKFYTGFPSFERMMKVNNFLNPGEEGENMSLYNKAKAMTNEDLALYQTTLDHDHTYSSNSASNISTNSSTKVPPFEQYFLTLCRVRVGMKEKDCNFYSAFHNQQSRDTS